MILREYEEGSEEEHSDPDQSDADEAPDLITSRADFDSMMNEFLNDYEILGRKMKPKLAGETGFDKLDTLRRAMGQDERVRISIGEEDDTPGDDSLLPVQVDDKDRWDCETILSRSLIHTFTTFPDRTSNILKYRKSSSLDTCQRFETHTKNTF